MAVNSEVFFFRKTWIKEPWATSACIHGQTAVLVRLQLCVQNSYNVGWPHVLCSVLFIKHVSSNGEISFTTDIWKSDLHVNCSVFIASCTCSHLPKYKHGILLSVKDLTFFILRRRKKGKIIKTCSLFHKGRYTAFPLQLHFKQIPLCSQPGQQWPFTFWKQSPVKWCWHLPKLFLYLLLILVWLSDCLFCTLCFVFDWFYDYPETICLC